MLIRSKFHDFYDSASSYGVDKECIYIREEKILVSPFKMEEPFSRSWPSIDKTKIKTDGINYEYEVKLSIVGFCGKLYPLAEVFRYHEGEKADREKIKVLEKFHFYEADKLKEFYKEEGLEIKKGEKRRRWAWLSALDSQLDIDTFFNPDNYKKLLSEFHNHKVPIFVHTLLPGERKASLILNPRLLYYRFGKVKDANTAFQDVYMFLSGVLGIESKETVIISDKQKAKKAGHDGPYSFRKMPGGKRGKPPWR